MKSSEPKHPFGATDLMVAVQQRDRERVDRLLAGGADINGRSDWWAGSFGVLDQPSGLEDYLISRGAIVDAHVAARLGMIDRLKAIVRADQRAVFARGGDGQTPLHFAATVAIADLLLEAGADIDAKDVDHESTAAQYLAVSHPDVARHLVACGCATDIVLVVALGDRERVAGFIDQDAETVRVNVSDHYFPMENPHAGGIIYKFTIGTSKSVHRIARDLGHAEVFQLLMDRSPADVKYAAACGVCDEPLARRILAGAPQLASGLPKESRGALVDAAVQNNPLAVRLLLEAGWPVDGKGQHGGTALHWAAYHGNVEMVEALLRKGPPLDVRDSDFDGTPLGWALHGSSDGSRRESANYPVVIERLKKAGAK